jgi:hypothetical protein
MLARRRARSQWRRAVTTACPPVVTLVTPGEHAVVP